MQWMNNQKKQTAVNLFSGILTMLAQFAISFVLSPYIVKTLGEEANGYTQLANNFVTYATLISLAFNSMAGRFIAVNYHQYKIDKANEYYSSTIVCNIVMCIIFVPIASIVIWKLENLITISGVELADVKILFGCVFLNFLVNLFVSVLSICFFVCNKIYIQNVINCVRCILNAVLLGCAFMLFSPHIYYVTLVTVVLSLFTMPIVMAYQRKLIPQMKFSWLSFRWQSVKDMIKSGVWNSINQCGHMFMTGFDLLLTNLYINPVEMGILSVAKIVPNAITSLAVTVNNSLVPALTVNWVKGNKEDILNQLRSSMKISSIIISVPLITFSIFSVRFYELWMPDLDAKMLAILSFLTCMAYIPWAGPQTLYNIFTVTNRLRVNSIAFVISGILNVVVVYCLLRCSTLGLYAVAGVSSIISILRNLILTAPYTARLLGLKWFVFYKDVGISLVCCGINAIVAIGVIYILDISDWLSLIFAIILACIFMFIFDVIFVMDEKDRKLVFNRLTR